MVEIYGGDMPTSTSVEQRRSGTSAPAKRVANVIAHELRCNVLSILSVRTASPNEMAADLGKPLDKVAYHTRVLKDAGAIELVGERPVRGSTEHFYRAIATNYVTDEEYAQMSPEQRTGFAKGTILFAFTDASAALDSGTMVARTDHCIARAPGTVDEEGWGKIAAIYQRALDEVLEEIGEAGNRLAEDPELDRIPMSALLTFFELPEPTRNSMPKARPLD